MKRYTNLANAIVKQAAIDYEMALCGVPYTIGEREDPVQKCKTIISECENFFKSDWFTVLTGIDGDYLIDRLKKEVIEFNRDWKSIKKAHNIEY